MDTTGTVKSMPVPETYFKETSLSLGGRAPRRRNPAKQKKIALTNLADLRTDLGLKLTEMAGAIKPITRQTLGAIENGEPKDAIYMRAVFVRLKVAFSDRFEIFDLVEERNAPGAYFIRYKLMSTTDSAELDYDRLSFQIMDLNNKIRRSMTCDTALMQRQEHYLRELQDTLFQHFKRDVAG